MKLLPGALLLALAAPLFVGGVVACEDKKATSDSARTDASAGADKYASADPKLEKALKAAASSSAAATQGPPATGIFEPGVADQRHAKGAPTKVDMVSEGADPKVSLALGGGGAAPAGSADAAAAEPPKNASAYGPAMLEVAMELNQRIALPTVDFAIVLAPAKKEAGGPDWLVGNVVRAMPAKKQIGALPPDTEKLFGALGGTELRVKVTPDGRQSDMLTELSKGATQELERLPQTATETLAFAMVPLPPKPVGVGGQWIAETRMPLQGIDVVAYRAFKVKSVDGDRVHLTFDVKAYAATKDVSIQGIPKGATFEQFDEQSQGELELVRGEALARKLDVQQRLVMIFAGPGGLQAPQQPGAPPGNMLSGQIQSQGTFVRGEDLRAAMKP